MSHLTTSVEVENFLEHFGKKGMRWGVRNKRSGVSKSKSSSKHKTTFQKSPSRLTDAQLNTRIKRMELEKKYKDLNQKDVAKGKKFGGDILHNSGKQIATTLIVGAAMVGISAALSKKMNPEMAKSITGKEMPKVSGFPGQGKLFG